MILFYELGNPLCEMLLISNILLPDIKNVFSSCYIVPIIYIFCDFSYDVLNLYFVVFSLGLLFDHIFALYFGDIYFSFLDPFYSFYLILLTLNLLLYLHLLFLFQLLCLVYAPSLEGIMLSSTHQSLNQAIFDELLVSLILVKPLAPPHNGFISLVPLELCDGLGYGFPIQTGLSFINLFENHFLFEGSRFKRALSVCF